MLIKPLSPPGSTSGTVNSGVARSFPFSKTRTRPRRSVKIIRPSGAQTIDHGTSRLPTTVSTLKLVCDCDEDSTSPAPRPGGGRPHANASKVNRPSTPTIISFIWQLDVFECRNLLFSYL